jgi:hypothetical protein
MARPGIDPDSAKLGVIVESDDAAGYRLRARGFGAAVISADGSLINFAPDGPSRRSHRFLVGRVLPLAAVLRGVEAFHASAIAIGDQAVAFIGASSAGKTSLAVNLMLRGASFVTDDVLALELDGGEVVAHPGPAAVRVRSPERAALLERGSPPQRPSGARVGELRDSDDAAYTEVDREARTLPLRLAYVLRREGPRIAFRRIAPPEPRLLLASTFVFEVRTPERMARQLDVCAQVAAKVELFELRIPPRTPGVSAAREVEAHANEILEQGGRNLDTDSLTWRSANG